MSPAAASAVNPACPHAIFVTGTDTGVGKTQVSCAFLSAWRQRGHPCEGIKPVETGCADDRPEDALALWEAAGSSLPVASICPYRFPLPLAPSVAARKAGQTIDLELIAQHVHRLSAAKRVVVEGAGGALVPYTEHHSAADLISLLGLPAVIVARAGLGTLNHTALTSEALGRRGIAVLAVVLNHTSAESDPSVSTNPAEIRRITGLPVWGPLPFIADPKERRDQLSRLIGREMDRVGMLA